MWSVSKYDFFFSRHPGEPVDIKVWLDTGGGRNGVCR